MTDITFGYDIHAEVIGDKDRATPPEELFRHLDRLKHRSGGHRVINRPEFAIQVAKAQPNHIIFIRYHPDAGMHIPGGEYKSPEKFVEMIEKDWNKCKAAGVTNIAFTTLNEPHPTSAQQIVDWHTNVDKAGKPIPGKPKGVLDLCAEKRIPIAAMQLGISDWELNELEILVPVFRKISQHDDLFSVAVHEYFGIVPSSGMPLPGYKDPEFEILEGAWSSPKAKQDWIDAGKPYFPIQPENWPQKPDERKYHGGRHQDIIDVCEQQNPPIDRTILDILEAGADDMSEGGQGWVGAWFRSIKVSTGFFNPRFWRSLAAQWAIWYGKKKGWNAEQTYWHMLKWLMKHVWTAPYKGKSRRVRSVVIFSWWNSGKLGSAEDWTAARVDNAYIFQGEHEKWVLETTPPPPPTEPDPADEGYYDTYAAAHPDAAIVYDSATGGREIHRILTGSLTDYSVPVRVVFSPGQTHWPIEVAGKRGYVNIGYIKLQDPEPPFNILPGDARWRKYKFYANGQTALVYQRPALGVRVGNGLAVGGVIVDHIPDELLTPVERTYLLRAQGVRWLVIQLATAGIGFVRERDATRRDLIETTPPPPPPDHVTIPKTRYEELLTKEQQLSVVLDDNIRLTQYASEFDTLKFILSKPSLPKEKVS